VIHWRRRRRARWLLAAPVIAAVVLATLPSTGLGSGAGVAQAPGVAHGKPVAPKVFTGDVRNLHQRNDDKKKIHETPEEPGGGFRKPPSSETAAPVEAPAVTIPTPSTSFKGLDHNTWGAGWPPDTVGDVGPDHFVQAVNTSIGIFSKTGTQLAAFTFNSLWASAGSGTACDTSNDGDPTVIYDPQGDRWIVADFAFTSATTGPYYECIAVSRSSDPVAGGWYLYAVRADDASHPWLPDYPKMGIWPDGLYMTANMFQNAAIFREVRAWAFNRSDLESGAILRSVVVDLNTTTYFSLLPSNLRGAAPPAGRENLLVSESQTAFAYQVFKFHVDYSGSGSTFTGPTNVSQTSYTVAATTVPSPANSLDSLRERLMMQAQYRNIGGIESLWVNHTVRSSSTGPTGVQWAQINVTGGTVNTTPVQQQIYGNVGSDGLHRWMGSLAVDKDGNMALGYSVSSGTLSPDIRYAGRLASDTFGTLPQGETTMLSGVSRGSQSGNCGGGTCTRWGDYSAMTVDPDGCTFWYTNEYYETTGLNWQTRIGSFKFAQCTSADTMPPTAADESAATPAGTTVPITLHGTDPEACQLTFSVVSPPANGSLGSITNNSCAPGSPNLDTASVNYTPNGGFSGADSFSYKVNDGTNDSAAATVSITVNGATTYDQTVLADSPVAYWRLGEGSGTSAADASGNGNAGTYQNGPVLGQPGLISGGDMSVSFDGTNDRVLAADSSGLSPNTAVSVEAWVRAATLAPSPGSYRTVLIKGSSYWLRVDNVSGVQRARFFISDAGTYYGVTATGVALTTGTTYHLVGTYDGTTLRIYINGVQQGSAAHAGAIDDSTTFLQISTSTAGFVWDGRIDEPAVYPTALIPSALRRHFSEGLIG
jgi:concanavalin A-like lectin/glucanase superfamily protein/Big-like domain-containing protein